MRSTPSAAGRREELSWYFQQAAKKPEKAQRYLPRPDAAWRAVRDLSMGLRRLHDRRIVHGDIKPDNLVVSHHPFRLSLIDFGSAWSGERARYRSRSLNDYYAAPEQHRLPPPNKASCAAESWQLAESLCG